MNGKKILRNSQVEFRKKLRNLRLRQNDDFLIKSVKFNCVTRGKEGSNIKKTSFSLVNSSLNITRKFPFFSLKSLIFFVENKCKSFVRVSQSPLHLANIYYEFAARRSKGDSVKITTWCFAL